MPLREISRLDLEADVLRMLVEDEMQRDVAPVGPGDHRPPVDGVEGMQQELLDRLDEDDVAGRRLFEQLEDVVTEADAEDEQIADVDHRLRRHLRHHLLVHGRS